VHEGESGPVIENGLLRISTHLNRGTFDVELLQDGRASLTDAAASVTFDGAPTITTLGVGMSVERHEEVNDALGRGLSLVFERERDEGEPDLLLTLTLRDGQAFASTRLEVVNRWRSPLRVSSFRVVDGGRVHLGTDPGDWRFYKEGWQDWSPALVLPVSGEDIPMSPPVIAPRTRPAPKAGRFLSELMTVVADPSSACLLAGFASSADQFSQVWLDREGGTITTASYADGVEVAPGERMTSETLIVEPGNDPLECMRGFGQLLGRQSNAVQWPDPVAGWCSWYYYFHGVTETEVLANLSEIVSRRSAMPFEYLQIDDGYQAEIGDWLTTNEKFPRGMGWLAGQIHEKGYKAGLWLAPFLIGEESQLWKDHPDWAVQYKPGSPMVAMLNWQQRCYSLDLTRPDVLGWLEGVFTTIFDGWGYDYVKIDFIYAGAVDGIRHDPNVTRAQAYRRGIDVVRKVAGDRFILGCGQPIGPSVGVVNGARIGPDVAPFWHPTVQTDGRDDMSVVSTLNAVRNVLSRWWMHDTLWLNDPDCLMVREDETALTLDEVRTLATVIALSGGMVLDSDNLSRLNDERREIISMMLPVYGRSGKPLDLFTAEGMPRLFELDCGTHRMLGVFNWGDDPTTVEVPLPDAPVHVFEVWSRRYLGRHQDRFTPEVPPHGCALLALRADEGRPEVVGSTFHLLQGAMEIIRETWEGNVLSVRLRAVAVQEGELFLFVPPGTGAPRASGAEASRVGDEVWALRLTVTRDVELRVEFG
jgi:alpha-galactosidase